MKKQKIEPRKNTKKIKPLIAKSIVKQDISKKFAIEYQQKCQDMSRKLQGVFVEYSNIHANLAIPKFTSNYILQNVFSKAIDLSQVTNILEVANLDLKQKTIKLSFDIPQSSIDATLPELAKDIAQIVIKAKDQFTIEALQDAYSYMKIIDINNVFSVDNLLEAKVILDSFGPKKDGRYIIAPAELQKVLW